jgi:hypothetical protein
VSHFYPNARIRVFAVTIGVQMGFVSKPLDVERNVDVTKRQIPEWYALSQFMTVMKQRVRRVEQEFVPVNSVIVSLLRTNCLPD